MGYRCGNQRAEKLVLLNPGATRQGLQWPKPPGVTLVDWPSRGHVSVTQLTAAPRDAGPTHSRTGVRARPLVLLKKENVYKNDHSTSFSFLTVPWGLLFLSQ